MWNRGTLRPAGPPGHFTLDVAYVGNHGVRTPTNVNLNVSYTLNSGQRWGCLCPRTQAYTERWRGFSSSYHSLQAKFDRRFFNGLSITSSFTWQKASTTRPATTAT